MTIRIMQPNLVTTKLAFLENRGKPLKKNAETKKSEVVKKEKPKIESPATQPVSKETQPAETQAVKGHETKNERPESAPADKTPDNAQTKTGSRTGTKAGKTEPETRHYKAVVKISFDKIEEETKKVMAAALKLKTLPKEILKYLSELQKFGLWKDAKVFLNDPDTIRAIKRAELNDRKIAAAEKAKAKPPSWISTYLKPYLKLSASTADASGLGGTRFAMSPAQWKLNSAMPAFDVELGLGKAWQFSKYDRLGRPSTEHDILDTRSPINIVKKKDLRLDVIPDFNFSHTKNYKRAANDTDMAADTGLAVHMQIDNFGFQLFGKLGLDWMERQLPSYAVPSGRQTKYGGGMEINWEPKPWLELRPYFGGYDTLFDYYKENFGKTLSTKGSQAVTGIKVYFKKLAKLIDPAYAHLDAYLPTVYARYQISNGTQGIPQEALGTGFANSDTHGWEGSFGLYWGESLGNLSLVMDYMREKLFGFAPVSEAKITASGNIPKVGQLSLSYGRGWGTFPFYQLDNTHLLSARLMAPEWLRPDSKWLNWGFEGFYGKYVDRTSIVPEHNGAPQYQARGARAILEVSY